MNREEKLPGWLNGLLELKFDEKCERHERMPNNVKNIYCLHCCVNFCDKCADTHDSHRILQVP
ncbi:hypothetical protein KSP39_PZI003150 [Platanthera zijinensis]|uniref:B box-type domain-containing protein n=1 Tax=Platanthera zijinensis TaxID=2320716 RepID=A0AAP0BTZ6_9ASPA